VVTKSRLQSNQLWNVGRNRATAQDSPLVNALPVAPVHDFVLLIVEPEYHSRSARVKTIIQNSHDLEPIIEALASVV